MDLQTQHPRSVRHQLGGYVHLARMIDKCRAVLAGTQGEYIYPCPLDRRLLSFADVTPEDFLEAVKGRSDDEVVSWLRCRARAHSDREREEYNQLMLSLGPDTEEKWSYFRSCLEQLGSSRTDITTWADLLDLEEGRPVPIREPAPAGGP